MNRGIFELRNCARTSTLVTHLVIGRAIFYYTINKLDKMRAACCINKGGLRASVHSSFQKYGEKFSRSHKEMIVCLQVHSSFIVRPQFHLDLEISV